MSFYMQKDGWKFLSGILAGSGKKIDGMYAEYSSADIVAGERSHDKYSLDNSCKYIRIPVASAQVEDDGAIKFTAYLAASDMPKDIDGNASIQCITLVSLDRHSSVDDVLVCTVSLKDKVKMLDNTYVVLHAGIKLGGSNEH